MPKKFKVNQKYPTVCWFTGGEATYTVGARSEGKILLTITRSELDGNFSSTEWKDIETDENGNESILLYEYNGEQNRIRAGYDAWGNEIYAEDNG